mgnify:CR=1 FL=1
MSAQLCAELHEQDRSLVAMSPQQRTAPEPSPSFVNCAVTALCFCAGRRALAALPADEPPFDLIFLDADKKRYPEYVDLLLERGLLAPHGLLLADNVLWKGRVLELLAPECAAAADAVDGRERRSLALRDALHGFNSHHIAEAAFKAVQSLVAS